jgi:hypothetical protein
MESKIDENDELNCVFKDLVEEDATPQVAETGTRG